MPDQEPSANKDFFEILREAAAGDAARADRFAQQVLRQAEQGEASALKLVAQAIVEGRFDKEQKIKLTDEQYADLIVLASERIKRSRVAKAS